MRSSLRALAILAPLALLLGGCLAVGQAFNLTSVVAALVAAGGGSIALAALDRREWIQNGSKPPFFAGTLRGGFCNPFDVVVRDRVPLAEAFTHVIGKSLAAKGFEPRTVPLEGDDEEAARNALVASGAPRSLLILIDRWQSDTMMNVGMHYLLTAQVIDASGDVIAQSSIQGEDGGKDNLKGSVMNPAGYAKKAVPKAFQDHIERLLNDEAIVSALS